MELQRGICSLCAEGGRVLKSSQAEEISKLLPEVLYENFLPQAEFQKIKNLIKICAVCCYKIQVAAEIKGGLSAGDTDEDNCHFCNSDKCLIRIDSNWKYFNERTEGCLKEPEFPLSACPRCMFYFDVIFTFRTKLVYKFPQLAASKKKSSETTPQKQNDTPKRKSSSKSPSSSKKRKIFDNCFIYLQPLCNKNYRVDEELKRDSRMYRKIAYVDMKNAKDMYVKLTPKQRPVIKIKLKPRGKKEKEPISKSEEITSKRAPNKKRRHSYLDKKESSEEPENRLDETPKSAIVSHPVPKRRVSDYMDNGEKSEEPESQEPKEEEKESEPEEKPQEPEERSENGDDTKEVEEDKPEEKEEEVTHSSIVANGEKTELPTETEPSQEEPEKAIRETISPSISIKSDSSSESSDSGSDKDRITNSESDVVNGSERKKKRVTFSDEIDI